MSHPTYVELHARSAFSFLRGASLPEDLIAAATALELPAVALLDRDGFYGAPRFYGRAQEKNFAVRPRVGAEITLEDGTVLPLLASTRQGYQNLCQLITESKLNERSPLLAHISGEPAADPHERKRPCFATWDELARFSGGLIALTGDEEGPVRRAWQHQGAAAAHAVTRKLAALFGRDNLYVELQRHHVRGEEREIKFLRNLAAAENLPLLATGGVNYAVPEHRIVSDVFTCLRYHTTLDAAGRRLDGNDQRVLKPAAHMQQLFRDVPEALANSVRLEARLEFTLENLGYEFPSFPTPPGQSMDDYLRDQVNAALPRRIKGIVSPELRAQLNRELELIARLKFSGYFLIVWHICAWARENNIIVQGRGSAANSAVCYVLGITAVNPVKHRLLFDRFLNDSRIGKDGKPSWPDIDLDFPSGERRERVIQEVYRRYGRRGAAMTANVITYRGRSTIREVGKVLGFGEDALDRFSSLYANGDFPETLDVEAQLKMAGVAAEHPRLHAMLRLQDYFRRALPRHLGQHSGGMVISEGQLDKVVPLEPASMPDRSICQWDKDDCENLGIVKIDFLGLGMMAVLQETVELCAQRPARDGPHAMDDIPENDPETYDRICAADTIGVFQIESRAQMSTLPRFKPRNLYDLAMQVALIRPGPITGNLVHPLIERRNDPSKIPRYFMDPSVHAEVEPILRRTCGVILFQEQMLELSMALAKFSGAQAEKLRRAMGFVKDQGEKLNASLAELTLALRKAGRNQVVIDALNYSAKTFAAYGFPESHAIGFGMLAYFSTWLKIHRTAEFFASLLNNQPMGFYSPATLVQDAKRRHGLVTKPICVQQSAWACTVVDTQTMQLGLRYVKGLRESAALQLVATRTLNGPFQNLADFLRRTDLTASERRQFAAVGALNCFGLHRRSALWQIEAAWSAEESLLLNFEENAETETPLVAMNVAERFQADFAGTGVTTGRHPMALLRASLPDVTTAAALKTIPDGATVTIAGSVICRQRPGTAKGVVFVSLEDETGIANAVVYAEFFEQHRLTITQESSLRITGRVQNVSGVIHVKTETVAPLRAADLPTQASHDFH